mgnify:CR=1 FL=1
MADNTENPGKAKPTRTRSAGATLPATAVPEGSILSADALIPGVGGALALEADVSGELAQIAPSFGDILASIGRGVADSQTALDRGLVSTATTLSQANITVVTDVVQELNDDGLPVPSAGKVWASRSSNRSRPVLTAAPSLTRRANPAQSPADSSAIPRRRMARCTRARPSRSSCRSARARLPRLRRAASQSTLRRSRRKISAARPMSRPAIR